MTQTYANHRRYFPLYHYFAVPVLGGNVLVSLYLAVLHPLGWGGWWRVLVALALLAGIVASRASTLIVQNRLIGLEMRLRLIAALPPELGLRVPELSVKQLVGLRFAGDDELPGLVARCLAGELRTSDEVKKQVREWRPDYLRA